MKQGMKCSECQSEEVRKDAWASWDVENQDWVLDCVFDYSFCVNCDNEIHIDQFEVLT